ncbi:MAG: chemotaxis protein [Cyanobacteria bacterium CRU_2_1]|nr:chemotaxis protein [Cyanobacteria bacterium CRU_2_1]
MAIRSFGRLKNNVVSYLQVIIIALSLASVFNLAVIYRQINTMTSDGRIVNYAGIVRGKTQRLIKLVLVQQQTEAANSDSHQKIGTIIFELDEIIKGLREGDENLKLIRVEDKKFQSNLEQLEQAWQQLKVTLNEIGEESTVEKKKRLLEQSEAYWELANETAFSAEAFTARHVADSKSLAIILCGVSLFLLIVILKISQDIKVRLKNTVVDLSSSSSEIATAIAEQERVASQQAVSVHETTTTMDELEASCHQSTEQAQAAVAAAQQALQLAEDGTQTVMETLAGMSAMEKKVEAIAEQIVRLSEQTDQINGISQLVSELANQTNMLALNSSVEAVRAGEHGKGFALVANEIRKLADQSQQSAGKIGMLISEIQKAINSAVMVTDEGTKTVKMTVHITQQTEQAFAGVANAVNKVALNNQQVSLNLKQQIDAIQQVVEAMEVISRGSQETAAGLAQTRIGTEHLNEAALLLRQMV